MIPKLANIENSNSGLDEYTRLVSPVPEHDRAANKGRSRDDTLQRSGDHILARGQNENVVAPADA